MNPASKRVVQLEARRDTRRVTLLLLHSDLYTHTHTHTHTLTLTQQRMKEFPEFGRDMTYFRCLQ